MKRTRELILAGVCTVMLTGCGGALPEMSDTQMNAISEYAAITLLKYDANSKSRLVDLSRIPEPAPVVEAAKPKTTQEQTSESQTTEKVDNTTTIDQTQSGDGSAYVESLESFLQLPAGVVISYAGCDVAQSYQQEDDLYFALEASAGKNLLILHFNLQNQSDVEQNIRLIDLRNSYRVTVNGDYTRSALTTMLDNDLSTFMGSVAPGESRSLVLLLEIDPEQISQINSLAINFKNQETAYTQSLL